MRTPWVLFKILTKQYEHGAIFRCNWHRWMGIIIEWALRNKWWIHVLTASIGRRLVDFQIFLNNFNIYPLNRASYLNTPSTQNVAKILLFLAVPSEVQRANTARTGQPRTQRNEVDRFSSEKRMRFAASAAKQ